MAIISLIGPFLTYLGELNVDWVSSRHRTLGLATQSVADVAVLGVCVSSVRNQLLVPNAVVFSTIDSLWQNGDCRSVAEVRKWLSLARINQPGTAM